mmetsp:Transcript_20122/g.29414  ORF Transcript_20122/g.29414 Transcript_20122/m.29414 type:complete len:139 (+) Transcript_20122:297-713(+)
MSRTWIRIRKKTTIRQILEHRLKLIDRPVKMENPQDLAVLEAMVVMIEMGRGAVVIVRIPAEIEGIGKSEMAEGIKTGIEVATETEKIKATIAGVGTGTEIGRREAETKIETGAGEAEIETGAAAAEREREETKMTSA